MYVGNVTKGMKVGTANYYYSREPKSIDDSFL